MSARFVPVDVPLTVEDPCPRCGEHNWTALGVPAPNGAVVHAVACVCGLTAPIGEKP